MLTARAQAYKEAEEEKEKEREKAEAVPLIRQPSATKSWRVARGIPKQFRVLGMGQSVDSSTTGTGSSSRVYAMEQSAKEVGASDVEGEASGVRSPSRTKVAPETSLPEGGGKDNVTMLP